MKKTLCIALSLLIVAQQPTLYGEAQRGIKTEKPSYRLEDLVEKPYLEILELAAEVTVDRDQFERLKRKFEEEKNKEEEKLKRDEKQLEEQIKDARKQLDKLNRKASRDDEAMARQRKEIHCHIEKLEKQLSEKRVLRKETIKVAYENKLAKLELLQAWPRRKREIQEAIASGKARQREFGDYEDIGFRKVGEGQEKDIKLGQDAIREMEQYGMMPPKLEDEKVTEFINEMAQTIARNSDLKVPLQVQVLRTEEINAFALPGGFLFVNTGLILKADRESELAGVLAHEIAHSAARHGARLMKRATIAGIIYQAAQVAALIFTGGVVGLGTYYALEYGFYGLGLFLSLELLGVSRDYELEADQLGVQYLWKAGYDPHGFITFFDKLASEKGYVRSTSFFRTHPAFSERIIRSFSEISYLPPKPEYTYDTPRFQEIKSHLEKKIKQLEEEDKRKGKRPSLIRGRRVDCDEEAESSKTKDN